MVDAGLEAFSVFFIKCASFIKMRSSQILKFQETTVAAIVRNGHARWKVENENNNVLKAKGCLLGQNFKHGNHYLSSLLLSLNLLTFLIHTVPGLVNKKYWLLQQALRKRQRFFQDMETLQQYILFDAWDDLFLFICKGLELDTS